MSHRIRLIASFVGMFMMVGMPLMAAGISDPSSKAVLATDLEKGTQIIGLLGIPLGELASIQARLVQSDSKETDRYLEILKVDDHQLSTPVRLMFSVWQWGNLLNSALPLNKVLTLRVYETGGMVGVPQSAMKETNYVETVGWGFSTYVVILYEEK
jgi:hypothetical protein